MSANDISVGDSVPSQNPYVAYFPCTGGNLMVANYAGPNHDMTGVADNLGNTWTSNHAQECDSAVQTCVHNYSARNATTGQGGKVTLTYSAASADTTQLYCIAGASPTPFDKAVVNQGNDATGSPTMINITPATANGLVLMNGSNFAASTLGFTTPTGALYQGCFASNQNTDGGGCAANNTWGLLYNTDTSAEAWKLVVWINESIANWAAEADAYEAAPISPQSANTWAARSTLSWGAGSWAAGHSWANPSTLVWQ